MNIKVDISSKPEKTKIYKYEQMIKVPGIYKRINGFDGTRFLITEFGNFYVTIKNVIEPLNGNSWKDSKNEFIETNEDITISLGK